jgi:hypothetical protein
MDESLWKQVPLYQKRIFVAVLLGSLLRASGEDP